MQACRRVDTFCFSGIKQAEVYLHMALWELHTPNSGKSKELQPRAHELRLMWAF